MAGIVNSPVLPAGRRGRGGGVKPRPQAKRWWDPRRNESGVMGWVPTPQHLPTFHSYFALPRFPDQRNLKLHWGEGSPDQALGEGGYPSGETLLPEPPPTFSW